MFLVFRSCGPCPRQSVGGQQENTCVGSQPGSSRVLPWSLTRPDQTRQQRQQNKPRLVWFSTRVQFVLWQINTNSHRVQCCADQWTRCANQSQFVKTISSVSVGEIIFAGWKWNIFPRILLPIYGANFVMKSSQVVVSAGAGWVAPLLHRV